MASIFLSHSSQDNEVAGEVARRLKEHGYDSLFLDFDPDAGIKAGRDWERELYRNLKLAGAVILLCSPSSVKLWDAATGQELLTLKGHTGFVHGVSFSPDGKRLASVSEDMTVKIWIGEERRIGLAGARDVGDATR